MRIENLVEGDKTREELVDNAKALQCAIAALGLSDACMAVSTDGDNSAHLDGYFERDHVGHISVSMPTCSMRTLLTASEGNSRVPVYQVVSSYR